MNGQGKNKFVAYFAAVNESTWEHIKLALSSIFSAHCLMCGFGQ